MTMKTLETINNEKEQQWTEDHQLQHNIYKYIKVISIKENHSRNILYILFGRQWEKIV